jgi:hypothetical protein
MAVALKAVAHGFHFFDVSGLGAIGAAAGPATAIVVAVVGPLSRLL